MKPPARSDKRPPGGPSVFPRPRLTSSVRRAGEHASPLSPTSEAEAWPQAPENSHDGARGLQRSKGTEGWGLAAELEGQIGSSRLDAEAAWQLPSGVFLRHCALRMAEPEPTREATVQDLALLLGGLPPAQLRLSMEALLRMQQPQDIYGLEVLKALLERQPLPPFRLGPVVRNRGALESTMVAPEAVAELRLPSSARVWAFGLEGGGWPGYRFQPLSRPGRYGLSFGAPGRYRVLLLVACSKGSKMASDGAIGSGFDHCLDQIRFWVER